MIRTTFLASALVAAASCLHAQEVKVRSGEHRGFTRLVLQIPPETRWSLTGKKNGASIAIALDEATYDIGSVFSRLSENRLLSAVQAQPGAPLELEFGCDCVASAFLFRDNMVVVDIAPGEYKPPLVEQLQPWPEPPIPQAVPNPPPPKVVAALPQLNVPDLENQLMSRVLLGADRHVLGLKLTEIGPRPSDETVPADLLLDLPANVKVSSVLDELRGLESLTLPQLETRAPCISDIDIGFDTWTDGRPFAEQVADLRAGLYQEFDRIDAERATALARLYAYHGFGAETARTLDLLDTPPADSARIRAIAGIADGQVIRGPNLFSEQQRCAGHVALWAALTEGQLHADANVPAIEKSFSALPNHLRLSFGPILSDIMVQAGQLEAARRILRAVDRIESERRPEVTLAEAGIAGAAGDEIKTEELLSEVISDSDAELEAPLALARLIEKRWWDRGAVSGRELELVAGYAVELRKSEMGAVMARSHAVALSLNQEFDAAFVLLRAYMDDEVWDGTSNRVLHILSERADDLTFLRYALTLEEETIGQLTTDAAIDLSGRLNDLGFAPQALALATRPQDQTRRRDRAKLRARAALMSEQPYKALLELSDDDSDAAQRLRARALAETREFIQTADLLRDLGDNEMADRYYWLAGAEDTGADAAMKFGALSELTRTLLVQADTPADKPLARAAALLEDSVNARAQIIEMLDLVQLE